MPSVNGHYYTPGVHQLGKTAANVSRGYSTKRKRPLHYKEDTITIRNGHYDTKRVQCLAHNYHDRTKGIQ